MAEGSERSDRPTLGLSLRRARRRRFVGRSSELELFRGALVAPEDDFRVLFLYGPGGSATIRAEPSRRRRLALA